MAAVSSYELLEDGKVFADYGRTGFNFENCRRYVIFVIQKEICALSFQGKRNLNLHTKYLNFLII